MTIISVKQPTARNQSRVGKGVVVQEPLTSEENLDRAMVTGAAWMILARLADRSLGFISTIVLVRLLAPADFGIIAMAMSVIAICELFNQMGLDAALIQNPKATPHHYDTAWTLSIIFYSITAIFLLILTIPAAKFYGEPRLIPILLALAVATFISGFENIGIVAFRKDLHFNKEFLFFFGKKLAGFLTTVPLALILRNYWALVAGIIIGRLAGVLLSYTFQEYRPRWSLAARKDLFDFSKWIALFNSLNVLNGRAADFIVGKMAGAHALGIFNISYEISSLPTSELIAPINRAVFPGYARKSGDVSVLRKVYLDVLGMIALFGIPAGVGIASTSDRIVPLLLGEKWTEAVPLIAVLAFYGILTAMKTNAHYVYLSLGKPRIATYLVAVQMLLLFPILVLFSASYGSIGAAYGYLVAQAIFTPISFSVLFKILNLTVSDIRRVLWRPFASAICMYAVVRSFISFWLPYGDSAAKSLEHLLLIVSLGLLTYIFCLYGMWRMSLRPAGAESQVLDALWKLLYRTLNRNGKNSHVPPTMAATHATEPLEPEIGICALVPDEWDSAWQPRHYVLTRLARFFHVVWVSPPRQWPCAFRLTKFKKPKTHSIVQAPGLKVYEPSWLAGLYRPMWLRRYIFAARLRRVRRMLVRRGARNVILYLWRPEFGHALNFVPFDLSCYHIDDEYSFSETEISLDTAEKELIQKVDQVFIHSPRLMERKGSINTSTVLIPNGVDFAAYSSPAACPSDLESIPRPIVGYTGFLKKWLDWPLILELATRHPEWSFVFVGPVAPHQEIESAIQKLRSLRNVYFLGSKLINELAAYPQHFDVCTMPYRLDGYTNNIYPMKLHEYLASGTPVVGSPIRSLVDFSHIIGLAEGAQQWSEQLAQALQPAARTASVSRARQDVAREYDWEKLANRIAQTMRQRLSYANGAATSAKQTEQSKADDHDMPHLMQELKSIVPRIVRVSVKRYAQDHLFSSALRAIAAMAPKEIPSHDLLAQLRAGWGNEGWSGRTAYLEEVVKWAAITPGPVLECGSGLTTLLLGLYAGSRGVPVWSLEHDAAWHQETAKMLHRYSIPGVELCRAPLSNYGDFAWYSPPLGRMPAGFSFVVCDGPPERTTRGRRYGLLPVMSERLVADCVILVDDVDLAAESVLYLWKTQRPSMIKILKADESQSFGLMFLG